MSCNKLNTILLGGRKGKDGKYPVQREILYRKEYLLPGEGAIPPADGQG